MYVSSRSLASPVQRSRLSIVVVFDHYNYVDGMLFVHGMDILIILCYVWL